MGTGLFAHTTRSGRRSGIISQERNRPGPGPAGEPGPPDSRATRHRQVPDRQPFACQRQNQHSNQDLLVVLNPLNADGFTSGSAVWPGATMTKDIFKKSKTRTILVRAYRTVSSVLDLRQNADNFDNFPPHKPRTARSIDSCYHNNYNRRNAEISSIQ